MSAVLTGTTALRLNCCRFCNSSNGVSMNRRETAINEAMEKIRPHSCSDVTFKFVAQCVLTDLIDRAEAGEFKDPLPTHRVGLNAVSDPGAE